MAAATTEQLQTRRGFWGGGRISTYKPSTGWGERRERWNRHISSEAVSRAVWSSSWKNRRKSSVCHKRTMRKRQHTQRKEKITGDSGKKENTQIFEAYTESRANTRGIVCFQGVHTSRFHSEAFATCPVCGLTKSNGCPSRVESFAPQDRCSVSTREE